MYHHFNDNNLLAEQQYGFRKLDSTEYAAVKLAHYISKQMESGNIPCNLYINFSKAFDTLCYDTLLYKLRYYVFFLVLNIEMLFKKQRTICSV